MSDPFVVSTLLETGKGAVPFEGAIPFLWIPDYLISFWSVVNHFGSPLLVFTTFFSSDKRRVSDDRKADFTIKPYELSIESSLSDKTRGRTLP